MTSEQYRTYLTESIKTGAQMMYDMAEDIAGKSDFISNLGERKNIERISNKNEKDCISGAIG